MTFSALRAATTAWIQALMLAYLLMPAAAAFLETSLPRLFLMIMSFVRPPGVFSLEPLKTLALAYWPLAILLTRFAFIAFMAFAVFVAFIAVIRRAMVLSESFSKNSQLGRSCTSLEPPDDCYEGH